MYLDFWVSSFQETLSWSQIYFYYLSSRGLSIDLLMLNSNGKEAPFLEAQTQDHPLAAHVEVELILFNEATYRHSNLIYTGIMEL